MIKFITTFALLFFSVSAHADLDKDQQQGLRDTQRLLRDKKERGEYLRKDKNAADMDAKVEALTGSGAHKDEIYDISAGVMEKITQESNGDPAKMQQLLNEAQKNPEAFYNKYFTPEQKARVKGLSNKLEKDKNPPRH